MKREWFRSKLVMLPGVKVYRSTTNFLLVRIPIEDVALKLSEKGIAVRPVPLGSEWIRVSVGLREENQTILSVRSNLLTRRAEF